MSRIRTRSRASNEPMFSGMTSGLQDRRSSCLPRSERYADRPPDFTANHCVLLPGNERRKYAKYPAYVIRLFRGRHALAFARCITRLIAGIATEWQDHHG